VEGNRKHIKNRVAFLEAKVPRYVPFVGIAALILIWELVCRLGLVAPLYLPAPTSIVAAGWELFTVGNFIQDIGASLYRIVLGYALGACVGIIIGLLLGFSRWAEALGSPIIYSLYPIPKIALLPLIVLWLGIGELPKVTIIALGVFFPVVINTFSGVKNVDPTLVKAAVSFGSNHYNVIKKVLLPGSLPVIFAGLRLAAGTSLLLLVASEMIAAGHGIGSKVLHYGNLMLTTKLMVGIAVLSLLGLLFNRSLQWLENKLLPWK